ncbi:hypothetical protein LFM09_11150 [Lentzea alba]|uniref:hypothetical protein n=1 Tax=Lentzea alba TaxID=2714351 RepID=UPI0039BF7E3D
MNGYEVAPDLLHDRIKTLTRLAELTGDLVATASRLAERQPLLGTAPPAQDLSHRLKSAGSGLADEVKAAEGEVRAFQQMLGEIKTVYTAAEEQAARTPR